MSFPRLPHFPDAKREHSYDDGCTQCQMSTILLVRDPSSWVQASQTAPKRPQLQPFFSGRAHIIRQPALGRESREYSTSDFLFGTQPLVIAPSPAAYTDFLTQHHIYIIVDSYTTNIRNICKRGNNPSRREIKSIRPKLTSNPRSDSTIPIIYYIKAASAVR
jgi:hypothetical protein